MNFKVLGTHAVLTEQNITPEEFAVKTGFAAAVRNDTNGTHQKKIAGAIYRFLDMFGRGTTAPAQHLKMISESPEWTVQFDDTVKHAYSILNEGFIKISKEQGMTKYANPFYRILPFGMIRSSPNLIATAILASIAGGVGLGGAGWAFNRAVKEDQAGIEADKAKIKHYEDLAFDLEEKMRKKYKYGKSS